MNTSVPAQACGTLGVLVTKVDDKMHFDTCKWLHLIAFLCSTYILIDSVHICVPSEWQGHGPMRVGVTGSQIRDRNCQKTMLEGQIGIRKSLMQS